MDDFTQEQQDAEREALVFTRRNGIHPAIPETEVIEVRAYPEDRDDEGADDTDNVVDELIEAARAFNEARTLSDSSPVGYVSNAADAPSRSDQFQFWTPAEDLSLGIGSLVRHSATDTTTRKLVDTYAIVTHAEARTLGLEEFAIHVYETDARPPIDSIQPAPSQRRPVVSYDANVIASSQPVQRPVLSGPVFTVRADELARVHGQTVDAWPSAAHFLLGLYADGQDGYGVFAEERARVLGPKQGHVIFSGLPGAGKTSLFLTLVISLYAQLKKLEEGKKNGAD